jgi:hypothetical protein
VGNETDPADTIYAKACNKIRNRSLFMTICWKYNDGRNGFCLKLPPYGGIGSHTIPTRRSFAAADKQEPAIYPDLLADAALIDAMHAASTNVSDKGVRDALQHGVQTTVQALQKRVGNEVSITLDDLREAA